MGIRTRPHCSKTPLGASAIDTSPATWISPGSAKADWTCSSGRSRWASAKATGAQDNTITENGAYTLTPAGITNNTVTRNGGATVFVTNEDEWYKAAYYKGGGASAGPGLSRRPRRCCSSPYSLSPPASPDHLRLALSPLGIGAALLGLLGVVAYRRRRTSP